MKKVHFFKACGRLGCTNYFFGGHDTYSGVEEGPDEILTLGFLKHFPNFQLTKFNFPPPEKIKKEQFVAKQEAERLIAAIAVYYQKFSELISVDLKPNQTQVVIGGDHSVTFSSVLAHLKRVQNPNDFGYIQLDSHGDMNLFSMSPSKNFHGMYIRPFISDFDIPQIQKLIIQKIPLSNLLFIGNLDLDTEEKNFFQEKNINNISGEDLTTDFNVALDRLQEFVQKFKYLHLSIDIDVFDQSVVKATGLPSKNGLKLEQVFPLLKIISSHPNLVVDLVEVNPQKRGALKAIKLAQKILITLL